MSVTCLVRLLSPVWKKDPHHKKPLHHKYLKICMTCIVVMFKVWDSSTPKTNSRCMLRCAQKSPFLTKERRFLCTPQHAPGIHFRCAVIPHLEHNYNVTHFWAKNFKTILNGF